MTHAATPDRATPDPSDEVVGAMHLPGWTRDVPKAAWLVLGLAALDAWARAAPLLQGTSNPLAWFWSLVHVATAVLPLGLLAVVIAGPSVGTVRRRLLLGTGMLAAAELLQIVRNLPVGGTGPLGVQDSGPLWGTAVEPVLAVLQVGGVVVIGVGLARAAQSRQRSGTPVAAATALVLGVLGTVVSVVVSAVSLASWIPLEDQIGVMDGYVAVGALLMTLQPLAWGCVAAAALSDRQPSADSLWRWAGPVLVLVALLVQVIVSCLSLLPTEEGTVRTELMRAFEVAALLNLGGMILLLAGLAGGPRPTDEWASTRQDDSGRASGSA